jgi:hypothetical protein
MGRSSAFGGNEPDSLSLRDTVDVGVDPEPTGNDTRDATFLSLRITAP